MIISDKMTTSRFKINQYNWFGQKLLTHHRYNDILRVRDHLSGRHFAFATHSSELAAVHGNERLISDHFNYLTGLALMKTSTSNLDELITTLQKLNFQKNGQYFLLLCQCLLYIGNHDSVVAICKQVLNREIDIISSTNSTLEDNDTDGIVNETDSSSIQTSLATSAADAINLHKQQDWCLQSIWQESIEFRKIFENVNKNRLINDPRLWFTFATSLELQFQLKDADLAYRVASKLASGQARQLLSASKATAYEEDQSAEFLGFNSNTGYNYECSSPMINSVDISGYHMPHIKYAEFCVRYRDDYKTAIQVLNQAIVVQQTVINYHLNPVLALTLCAQRNSNSNHFAKANEILSALDNHSVSTRNPSSVYNQIALKCKQKLYYIDTSLVPDVMPYEMNILDGTSDEKRLDLNYALIKSYVLINDIVHNSSHDPMLYKSQMSALTTNLPINRVNISKQLIAQIDKTIEAMRNCDPSCWLSHSLWNNLGVCYLMKRRYIASLTCLIKAHRLNPLDWRINYNLSLAFMHVDLTARALNHSLASRNIFKELVTQKPTSFTIANSLQHKFSPIVNTLLASCYSGLGSKAQARRFYSEMMAYGRMSGANKAPVLTFVNYLLLLHRASDPSTQLSDDQDSRLIGRLLDQLEQAWLQRNPNDTQFMPILLETARLIGESVQERNPQMRKTYAWTKCNQ